MAQSFRQSTSLIASPKHLDGSVEEVFLLMLGVRCECIDDEAIAIEGDQAKGEEKVTAVVGFGGMLSGACVLRCGAASAMNAASRLTGIAFSVIDDTVKDGIGEICNMLAGAWKGRVPGLAASCGLSLPAVITGSDYRIHVQAPEFQLERSYRFEHACFSVTIICDSLQ
jgi:chemotaxis protein CheX